MQSGEPQKNDAISLRLGMVWNSFGSLFGLGCQWLITVFVVRLASGYEDAGVYSLAVSVYGIFSPIAQYRMYTYQVSDVKGENSTSEYMAFRCVTNALALAACMVYSFVTCSPDAWLAIAVYGVYKSITLLIDVMHGCDQRHDRIDYIGKSLALQGGVSLLAFMAVFSLSQNLELALGGTALGVLVVGAVFDYPRTKKFDRLAPGITFSKTLYLLKRCVSIVVAGIAVSASSTLPRQYLSLALGNAALGIYASVAAPVAIIQMGVSYIYNPLLGYFSKMYAARDKAGFYALFAKVVAAMIAVGLACSIGVMLLGEPILALVFGEGIVEYAYLLQPLVILAVVTGFTWFVNDLLISLRNFVAAFVGSIVSLVISAVLMVPFVNMLGMNGVTFSCLTASSAGILVMVVLLVYQLHAYWRN